ncbi:GTPase-activating protein CdGAPr isoform X2 [Lycorma delicatula]|uniref:GTPase-activating protein CdGAPr isoform X2 n=1 Tax=Lycorma delicatula TaxID=130591 RepID=UPI003F51080A
MFIEPPQPLIRGMAAVGGSRRARGLTDILPQTGAMTGSICSEGNPRIQHLTAASVSPEPGKSRFPKLEECAHFHYEHVELGPLQVSLCTDEDLKPVCDGEGALTVRVTSGGQSWLLRRTYENFRMLDQQLHRCIYDRKFSQLLELPENPPDSQNSMERTLDEYLRRFSAIAGSLINCGPVLSWLELDNRGHRLLVTDGDNCPINTPAVAAAYSIKKYTAIAADEISFDIGDMISVIDMPPPEESAWWRGKKGFLVGFFPSHCVAVITDKLPRNLNLNQALAVTGPTKPVLRKHGKLIAFFRAFILSRPSRRRLRQSGILRERVFGCDLGEHLLNSGHEIPLVLKCCAEFIEKHGLVDGIYRLSGVTSNIQKLRTTFDEDRVPALYEDEAILQDIHSVASLLKMYFRELPNPLCTYQLYDAFVSAVQTPISPDCDCDDRLLRMREAVHKLPPPHYRTLEYLMRHLAKVSEKGSQTGMTARNIAIVWAPNLLRCKELEVGGVAALQGVGVQAVVTEFLIVYAELIFCNAPIPNTHSTLQATPKRSRPKSLAISTPTKLLSLEEAQNRVLAAGRPDQDYIEVGGGPACLPAKYHTVIDLPRKRAGSKRSPLGWKSLFSKAGRHSSVSSRKSRSPSSTPGNENRKASVPSDMVFGNEKALTEADLAQGRRRLRPVKSAESLASASQNASARSSGCLEPSSPSPPSPALMSRSCQPPGHNRSVSHDSYFDTLADNLQPVETALLGQLLQEEDEEDLSELQVNFDLEESDMKIFSEDETNQLFSSQTSVEVHKRQPLLARCDDTLSGDPSPKKHKTGTAAPTNQNKRSRLEERFSNADLRYIDSQSPEQAVRVEVEVHNSPNQSHSPSLAEATVSENESLTLSGLTTPDTPRLNYTPLTEDSLSDAVATPDYVPLSHNSKLTPSPTCFEARLPGDRLSYQGDVRLRYENIPGDRLSFQGVLNRNDDIKYENIPGRQTLSSTEFLSVNTPDSIGSVGMKTDEIMYEKIKSENGSDIYENIDEVKMKNNIKAEKYYENVPAHSDDSKSKIYEQVLRKDIDSSYEEISGQECLVSERLQQGGICSSGYLVEEMKTENEYECLVGDGESSPEAEEVKHVPDSNHNVPSAGPEENFYEDVQGTPLSESLVYQQVKYLRRSVHEINQLLEESMEPCTGEDISSLEEDTNLISPSSNGPHDGEEEEEEEEDGNGGDNVRDDINDNEEAQSILPESLDITRSPSLSSKTRSSIEDQTFSAYSCQQGFIETTESGLLSNFKETGDNISTLSDDDSKHCTVGTNSTENLIDMDESTSNLIQNKDKNQEEMEPENSCKINEQSVTVPSSVVEFSCEIMEVSLTDSNLLKSSANVTAPNTPSATSRVTASLSADVKPTSPTRKLAQNLDENRRKFESEIGRDIVRERKMRQELEANSSSTGNAPANGQNVQVLMSRFEWSKNDRNIAPCLKMKLSRQNSKESAPTLTTSLDASSFPCDAPPLPRVKTSPDLNQNQDNNQQKDRQDESVDSEAVRRERIEKYKEERRSYLRKKYRTDSFNNNDDKDEEMIRRFKQKAKTGGSVRTSSESSEIFDETNVNISGYREVFDSSEWKSRKHDDQLTDVVSGELESRLTGSKSNDTPTSPVKTTVSISYSPIKIKTSSFRDRKVKSESDDVGPLRLRSMTSPKIDKSEWKSEILQRREEGYKSVRHKSEELPPAASQKNSSSKIEKRNWRGDKELCSDESSLVARRVNQLSSSSSSSESNKSEQTSEVITRRRTSLTDNKKPTVSIGRQRANSSSAKSPPYCIREMAAMFENREK